MRNSRVVFVDAKNLCFRAHFGFKDLQSKAGFLTTVLHGFPIMLLDCMSYLGDADYVIVWDGEPPYCQETPTAAPWRKALYPGYKSNRKPNDETEKATSQFKELSKLLRILAFPQIGTPGLEADDLIGIGTAMMSEDPRVAEAFFYSNDQDLLQLVGEKVSAVVPRKGGGVEEMTARMIREKLGVSPIDVPKLKALAGDASDAYKPVPGVGDKGAVKFLALGANPALERFSQHLPQVQAEISKLAGFWSEVHTCFKLATIPRSVTHGWFPSASLAKEASASMESVMKHRQRKTSRETLDKRLRSFIDFCSRYDLDVLLSRKKELFRGLHLVKP